MLKVCPICQKEFEKTFLHRVYCSHDCYYQSCVIRNRARSRARSNSKEENLIGSLRTCVICGESFQIKTWNAKTCGKYECWQEYNHHLHKINPKERKPASKRKCKWCFKPIEGTNKIYCSSEHSDSYRKMTQKIMNNLSGEEEHRELAKLDELGSKYVLPKKLRPMTMDEFKARIERNKQSEKRLPNPYVLEVEEI